MFVVLSKRKVLLLLLLLLLLYLKVFFNICFVYHVYVESKYRIILLSHYVIN